MPHLHFRAGFLFRFPVLSSLAQGPSPLPLCLSDVEVQVGQAEGLYLSYLELFCASFFPSDKWALCLSKLTCRDDGEAVCLVLLGRPSYHVIRRDSPTPPTTQPAALQADQGPGWGGGYRGRANEPRWIVQSSASSTSGSGLWAGGAEQSLYKSP